VAVVTVARIVAKEEHAELAEKLLRECAVASRAEAGVLTYEICRGQESELLAFEIYRDEAARQAHRASAHVKRIIVEQLRPISREFEVSMYDLLELAD
jgi:quinol monooxygenase YgiN